METHKVKWSTAKSLDDSLLVEVEGTVSTEWVDAFKEAALEHQKRHREEMWLGVTILDSKIHVSGIQPATDGTTLAESLQSMARSASHNLESSRQLQTSEEDRKRDAAAHRARRAAELADELRQRTDS